MITTNILLIAGLAGLLAAYVAWEIVGRPAFFASRATKRALTAERQARETDTRANLPEDSLARKLYGARLNITPLQYQIYRAALGVVAAFIFATFLVGGLPAVVAGVLAWWAPQAYINDKALSERIEIEKIMPQALSQIAAGVQAGRPVRGILESVGVALHKQHGDNPLGNELLRAAQEMKTAKGRGPLLELARRTPSLSLSNFAMLLASAAEVGGGKYAEAIVRAAQNVQGIIAVRNNARLKSTQATQTARAFPVMIVLMTLYMKQDPFFDAAFQSGAGQVVATAVMLVMVAGGVVFRNMVRSVV